MLFDQAFADARTRTNSFNQRSNKDLPAIACLVARFLPVALFATAITASPAAWATVPTVSNVQVAGIARDGEQLTGTYLYDDTDGDLEGASILSWYRDGGVVPVGSGNTYNLTAADIGSTLEFGVTPVAQTGAPDLQGVEVRSAATVTVVANQAPVATGVSISGTAEVGQQLTGNYTYGDTEGDPEGATSFQWRNNGNPIGGATNDTYILQPSDENDMITFVVTPVATTGTTNGSPTSSSAVGPVLPANTAPVAQNISITGTVQIGSTLTGIYDFIDADGDLEGTSTFRWLRGVSAIPGQVTENYQLVGADIGQDIRFEVTPVALTGVLVGTPVLSAPINADNTVPIITGQLPLSTPEETALQITLNDLQVTDPDNSYPADFTLTVGSGTGYSVVGTTITPDVDVSGDLTIPVTVNDGIDDSAPFNLTVTVIASNDQPQIIGQQPLSIPEDSWITILLTNLIVEDPDNVFPTDFTMTVGDGADYSRSGDTITPTANFAGQLMVPVTVSDGLLTSPTFMLLISVTAENDPPTLVAPIGPQQAVEMSSFVLDISANFTDPDNPDLTYTAIGLPASGNISLNPSTGVFSGTPLDSDAQDFPYDVTVTASDGTLSAFDTFALTISALDRANIGLSVTAAPTPAALNDDVQFSFTIRNGGPQGATNIALDGSFIGQNLTVTPTGATTCTTQAPSGGVTDFSCMIGNLALGAQTVLAITASSSNAGAITLAATAAVDGPVPIDPNTEDNSAQHSVGVAESFSNGAVQILGNSQILSVAHGDLNNDGFDDIVLGTGAGQPVQVFLSDGFRGFGTAISVPDNAAQNGVALADFDNNGTLDMALANAGVPDTVYSNNGAGNFTLMATLPGATLSNDVAYGFFDNNNNADLVFAVNGANPVYLGDGSGGFSLSSTLGAADSRAVAVGRLTGNGRDDDAVFANVGSRSSQWNGLASVGNNPDSTFNIGDASSVVIAELIGGGDTNAFDVAFGRIPMDVGDIPGNPVFSNNGNGGFSLSRTLGAAPTNDILAGDVNRDGQNDLVFVNDTGLHQVWNRSGGNFTLHSEQIVDDNAVSGVIANLGDTDVGEPGGVDLVMGGNPAPGAGLYLNDGLGNLGMGDITAPTMVLNGNDPMEISSGPTFNDPRTTATDNIDGDISARVIATGNVNPAVVGTYTVTYNVTDRAGNAAEPITRTVVVVPGTGTGGGGGGSLSLFSACFLLAMLLVPCSRRRLYIEKRVNTKNQ